MPEAVIIDGARSPIGMKNGKMIGIRPDDLTAQVVKGLLDRNPDVPIADVEDLVLGCAFPEGPQGMLMARGVGILAGLPTESGGSVVNRFCGSSMDAVHQISARIESGDLEIGIAAGVEDMFSVPMGGFTPDFNAELAEQEYYIGMGETAETLAKDGSINRDDQEAFAVQSHEKALKAAADENLPMKLFQLICMVKAMWTWTKAPANRTLIRSKVSDLLLSRKGPSLPQPAVRYPLVQQPSSLPAKNMRRKII